MTEYVDTKQQKIQIIKDWKDLFTQIGDNQSLLSSLKDSIYYKNFGTNHARMSRSCSVIVFRGASTDLGTALRDSGRMFAYAQSDSTQIRLSRTDLWSR